MKIDQVKQKIEDGFQLIPPITANDITSYQARAIMMKKKLSEEDFNKWLGRYLP